MFEIFIFPLATRLNFDMFLKKVCWMTPTQPWILLEQKYLTIRYEHFGVLNFNPFCSVASRFRFMGHFDKSALNDLKMTLNTIRSKVPNTCIRKWQISICFTEQMLFRDADRFEKIASNDAKMTLSTSRSKIPNICTDTPWVPKFLCTINFFHNIDSFFDWPQC